MTRSRLIPRTRLDSAIIASVLATLAMNLVVLAQQLPAPRPEPAAPFGQSTDRA